MEIARVLRELTQPDARAVDHAVEKYFTDDAQMIGQAPLLPRRSGPRKSTAGPEERLNTDKLASRSYGNCT